MLIVDNRGEAVYTHCFDLPVHSPWDFYWSASWEPIWLAIFKRCGVHSRRGGVKCTAMPYPWPLMTRPINSVQKPIGGRLRQLKRLIVGLDVALKGPFHLVGESEMSRFRLFYLLKNNIRN